MPDFRPWGSIFELREQNIPELAAFQVPSLHQPARFLTCHFGSNAFNPQAPEAAPPLASVGFWTFQMNPSASNYLSMAATPVCEAPANCSWYL
jgi:hypothetical protein